MPLPRVMSLSLNPCCDMHWEHLSPSAGHRTPAQDKPQEEDGDFHLHRAHQPGENPTPNPVIKPSSWLASPELLPRSRRLLGEQEGRDAEHNGQIQPGRVMGELGVARCRDTHPAKLCCFPGTHRSALPSPAGTGSTRLAVLSPHCCQTQAKPCQSVLQGKRAAQLSPSCGQGQGDPTLQERL